MTKPATTQPSSEPHAPVIHWPCEDLPYEKTIRARYWFRYRYWLPASYFVPMVLSPIWIAYGFYYGWPNEAVGKLYAFVPLGGLGLWLVCYLLFVRPLKPFARESRTHCGQWREDWKRFERQSNELKARIASYGDIAPVALLAENPSQWIPEMPATGWYLSDRSDVPLGQIQMPNDGDVVARAKVCTDAIYSYMLLEMINCGGQSVVGTSRVNGQGVLCACFMIKPNVQLWAKFTVRTVGNTVSTDIQVGHHWWIPKGTLIQGGHYGGDVASTRLALLLPENYSFLFIAVFFTAAFPVGAIFYWVMVAFALASIVRQLRTRQFTGTVRYECAPGAGDSSDMWVMEEIRRRKRNGFGVALNQNVKAEIESLSRRLILAAQRAASMKGVLD